MNIKQKEPVYKTVYIMAIFLTYRNLPNIRRTLTARLPLHHRSERYKHAFKLSPMMTLKNWKNIQDIQIHDELNNMYSINRCGRYENNMLMCEGDVKVWLKRKEYQVKGHINCTSIDVVYVTDS